jgi:hypothetical protein
LRKREKDRSDQVSLTPTTLKTVNLTPTPLLQERGYISDYKESTLLLLKEKELEDEVKKLRRRSWWMK